MAKTNFAELTSEEKLVWARDVWKTARNASFINKFSGTSHNSMIHRVTELTKTERGSKAVVTLVPDLEGDGVTGDYDLENNEESIKAYDMTIQIDQLRNANRTKGKMTDQKSIVNFRETSRDVLGYWLADRYDQQAFLTLSGVPFTKKNNGGNRPVKATGQNMGDLEYAADISAPSTNRHFRVSGEDLVAGDIAAITSSDKFGYKHVVQALAIAKDKYLRGVKGNGGAEMFHMFLTPTGLSQLKLDSDFLANVRNAGVRGDANPLFKGGESFMLDGVMIHSYRHVFNTKGAGAGDKWGGAGNTDGQRILLCGAQSLAMADIGAPEWEEDKFDYKNQQGISIGKMCGFRKPVFHSTVDGGEEDFGVIAIDTAL